MDNVQGIIEVITYVNEENGFTIAKLMEETLKTRICIMGNLSMIKVGQTIKCNGQWGKHPKYGKQFKVKEFEETIPFTLIGVKKYLQSGLIKGIGVKFADRIIETFGKNSMTIIDETPDELLKIEGIGKKKLVSIKKCWNENKEFNKYMLFFKSYGIGAAAANKIYDKYKEECVNKIKENPYILAKDIIGIGFKLADNIAKELGFSLTSSIRIKSSVDYLLTELSTEGHTCFLRESFIGLLKKLLSIDADVIITAIDEMIEEEVIIQKSMDEKEFIWLVKFYYAEVGVANEIKRILHANSTIRSINEQKAIEWINSKQQITFAEEQKEAIQCVLKEKFHIITGGPGTGKSTITKAILSIIEKIDDNIILAAPTGRAAKRLSQITMKKAFTIHSLLSFDFKKMTFKRNRNNPLTCSLLIVDETSMLDTFLTYHLLKAIKDECKVVFIGDIDQLPSIGAGYVLNDLIKSNIISVTKLKKIFRQSKYSNIIINSHRINNGEFPYVSNTNNNDFFFFEINEVEEIKKKIFSILKEDELLKKFCPFNDIQVLSPMNKGELGIEKLNSELQDLLNPSNKPFFCMSKRYHVGDKVMQVRNNYDKKVYNGDIGLVNLIDMENKLMIINFENRLVEYDFTELIEIKLAYAVSVHKYQGSETNCIIMPLHMSHFILLHKNLLYTAITRGKKKVILVGSKKALAMAIKNTDVLKRYTGLAKALLK